MRTVLSEAGAADLEAIADWIAADNPRGAIRFAMELRQACEALALAPRACPILERYAEHGVWRRVYGAYLILYRIEDRHITILHVIHGARDYEDLLSLGD
ncbi:MAG TPA: type II toxin-antitoxin system RelE/ParE family toxin [Caulobacteraceae bacterium]